MNSLLSTDTTTLAMSSAFAALLHQSMSNPASVSWKRDAPFDEEEAVPVRTGPWMNLLHKRA